jgi:hypothetical protein
MTPESTTRFILGATDETCLPNDNRITGLFDGHDKDKDGRLQREEFIEFYQNSARANQNRVLANMSNHFILKDLTKLSDIYEETDFKHEQMPRLTISQNQD